jgi:hypothetical protein
MEPHHKGALNVNYTKTTTLVFLLLLPLRYCVSSVWEELPAAYADHNLGKPVPT